MDVYPPAAQRLALLILMPALHCSDSALSTTMGEHQAVIRSGEAVVAAAIFCLNSGPAA